MTSLTISRLAAAAEVGIETIRFYQRKGLLRVPAARGTIRQYDPQDLERLRFIRAAQRAGFRLAEIAELLQLDPVTERDQIRRLAQARLDQLDQQIATLSAAKVALTRLVSDCARGDAGPCPIIRAFN
jgi:MerR family mercuric resistance operon transcriptional regulator